MDIGGFIVYAGNSTGSNSIEQHIAPSHQIMWVGLTKMRTNIPIIAGNLIRIHHLSLRQQSTKLSAKCSCRSKTLERLQIYNYTKELKLSHVGSIAQAIKIPMEILIPEYETAQLINYTFSSL